MQARQTISTVEIKKQIEDKNYRWYVLSVVSGQESLVIENIKERVKKQQLEEMIIDYLNPVVDETVIKRDKKVIREKKLYPWYVFVKSQMNDKVWYVIRNTPWVRIIVWAETHPIPLSESEYQNIIKQIEMSNERSQMVVPFQEWDIVLMNDGNFTGMKGVVKEVDVEKWFVVVNVEMLWRLTPVMVDFDKIELVS